MRARWAALAIAATFADGGCPAPTAVEMSGYKVIASFPHDSSAFTQGLIFRDGFLYESTGLYGQSSLRKVELASGQVVQERRIDRQYFAEGLTEWQGRLIQLTWKESVAFVYERGTFADERTISYTGEGWGLTNDGTHLVLSDGSDTLKFLDPSSFAVVRQITVKERGTPVEDLNELEFVRGEIYANVWQTDRIARINPANGTVVGWIDLTGLIPDSRRTTPDAVLNGIAYDSAGQRLFVTGKLWPAIFHIELVLR
jgi:glutaminyl-peptide cyclotransferase